MTSKLHGYALPEEAVASAIAACKLCPEKKNFDDVADLLAFPSLGRIEATHDHEILVFDIGEIPEWSDASHRYIIVGKLLSRQFILIHPLTSKSCASVVKDWLAAHPYVKTIVHDNAREFEPVDKHASTLGIHIERSALHRDALKRFQERAVGQAKQLLYWCIKVAEREWKGLKRNWNHLTVMAQWLHNTRVSPKLKAIPWSLTYTNPCRSDLFPLQIVNVIHSSKINAGKATTRLFLGLASPTKAVVWTPKIEKQVEVVHPTQLRVIKPSIPFILAHFGLDAEDVYDPAALGAGSALTPAPPDSEVPVLGSLAATSSRLPADFRRDPRWTPAVHAHAVKLMSMDPPPLTK